MASLRELRLDRNPRLRDLPTLPRALQVLHLEGCRGLGGSAMDPAALPAAVHALAGDGEEELADLQLPDGAYTHTRARAHTHTHTHAHTHTHTHVELLVLLHLKFTLKDIYKTRITRFARTSTGAHTHRHLAQTLAYPNSPQLTPTPCLKPDPLNTGRPYSGQGRTWAFSLVCH